jgi:hypothetical protein
LLGLLFIPEDGSNMFLQNISWLSIDYMALYSRRKNSWQRLLLADTPNGKITAVPPTSVHVLISSNFIVRVCVCMYVCVYACTQTPKQIQNTVVRNLTDALNIARIYLDWIFYIQNSEKIKLTCISICNKCDTALNKQNIMVQINVT